MTIRKAHVVSEYESRARKDKSEGKIDPNYFRSIHFNDWLALIMQVCVHLFPLIAFSLTYGSNPSTPSC